MWSPRYNEQNGDDSQHKHNHNDCGEGGRTRVAVSSKHIEYDDQQVHYSDGFYHEHPWQKQKENILIKTVETASESKYHY